MQACLAPRSRQTETLCRHMHTRKHTQTAVHHGRESLRTCLCTLLEANSLRLLSAAAALRASSSSPDVSRSSRCTGNRSNSECSLATARMRACHVYCMIGRTCTPSCACHARGNVFMKSGCRQGNTTNTPMAARPREHGNEFKTLTRIVLTDVWLAECCGDSGPPDGSVSTTACPQPQCPRPWLRNKNTDRDAQKHYSMSHTQGTF